MSLEAIQSNTIKGAAIKELQSKKREVVAGAAALTNIAVADITTDDTLISVLQQDGSTGVLEAERVGEASISEAGQIQLSTTNTTGKVLLVEWLQKPTNR